MPRVALDTVRALLDGFDGEKARQPRRRQAPERHVRNAAALALAHTLVDTRFGKAWSGRWYVLTRRFLPEFNGDTLFVLRCGTTRPFSGPSVVIDKPALDKRIFWLQVPPPERPFAIVRDHVTLMDAHSLSFVAGKVMDSALADQLVPSTFKRLAPGGAS